MSAPKIIPVILAGGKGTRLWPVSREDLPKQFCAIDDGTSLFQQSIARVQNNSMFGAPIIVTGDRYVDMVRTQLDDLNCQPLAIISEPVGRDTAAAVLLAVEVTRKHEDQLLLVMPSDHLIADELEFMRAVKSAAPAAHKDGLIVTFGIRPSHPETGFGYIRAGAPLYNRHVCDLECFIEKPDQETADKLVQDPNVFWNAGIFLFNNETVRGEFTKLAPKIFGPVFKSVINGTWNGDVFYPDRERFHQVPAISFDYAIMEPTQCKATIAVNPHWSDLGSWKAVWETAERDECQNVVGDNCYAVNARDSYIRSDGPIVGVAGVDDVVVVASPDAVLVTSRSNPQDVKKLVDTMKEEAVSAATQHIGADRVWGRTNRLSDGDCYSVRHLQIKSGQALPTVYHHHRDLAFTVVRGSVYAVIDDVLQEKTAGEQVLVPKGAKYHLANASYELAELIEIRFGTYLSDDDFIDADSVDELSSNPDQSQNRAA
ncbi:MAG: mannose-1-phosphate guanylyltransferase/mannose-6-phosphate isomerase [Rhizobiaceae bacterium]